MRRLVLNSENWIRVLEKLGFEAWLEYLEDGMEVAVPSISLEKREFVVIYNEFAGDRDTFDAVIDGMKELQKRGVIRQFRRLPDYVRRPKFSYQDRYEILF